MMKNHWKASLSSPVSSKHGTTALEKSHCITTWFHGIAVCIFMQIIHKAAESLTPIYICKSLEYFEGNKSPINFTYIIIIVQTQVSSGFLSSIICTLFPLCTPSGLYAPSGLSILVFLKVNCGC